MMRRGGLRSIVSATRKETLTMPDVLIVANRTAAVAGSATTR